MCVLSFFTHIPHIILSRMNEKGCKFRETARDGGGRRERNRGLMVGGVMVGVRTNYLQARCSGEDGVTNFTLTPGRLSHQWPAV